ncbi:MAG: FAD-dependent oxidoreductase, partial [Actinomycetes bacterium]
VIGSGLAGSAAARSIAIAGHRVTVLERFEEAHLRGSSHGAERVFRLTYDDPAYIQLGLEALSGWALLSEETSAPLLHQVGMLDYGDEVVLETLEQLCASNGVELQRVSQREASQRWGGIKFDSDVLLQPVGGWIAADLALKAFAESARRNGAEFHYHSPVLSIAKVRSGGWRVETQGGTLTADAVVVTTAGWTHELLGDVLEERFHIPPIKVTTEVVAYFERRDSSLWPSFCHHLEPEIYGLPSPDGLVKIAEHGSGAETHPDERSFDPDSATIQRLEEYARQWLPGIVPTALRSATCLYAATPTDDLFIERSGSLILGVGLGGHGFKFGPAVGDRIASLVNDALSEASQ